MLPTLVVALLVFLLAAPAASLDGTTYLPGPPSSVHDIAVPGTACLATGLVAIGLLLLLLAAHRRQKRLEGALHEERAECEKLTEVLDRINQGQSLPEVLTFLYDTFQDLLPCDRIGYSVIEGDTVRAAWARTRFEPIRLGVGTEAPLASTSLGRLAEEGGMRILNDLEAYLATRPQSRTTRLVFEEGMRSSLTVPLRAFGQPVGFLFFNSTRKDAYTERHATILQTLATQLSIIIEKSRLMTELTHANTVLAEQAATDPLTGLANRRSFEHHLQLEWLRMRRSRKPLSVLVVDIDHFKAYNDRYGHSQGDTCLVAVARVLSELAQRPGDLAARWGGEEFSVVLEATSLEDATRLAESLRSSIESKAIPHGGSPVRAHLTVSVGVASVIPGVGGSWEQLFEAADAALYRAKAAGRNRVEVTTLT